MWYAIGAGVFVTVMALAIKFVKTVVKLLDSQDDWYYQKRLHYQDEEKERNEV